MSQPRILSLVFILQGLFLGACDQGSVSRVQKAKIIKEPFHWGEYLQIASDQSLITVRRDGTEGLVRLDPHSETYVSLDTSAQGARDILTSGAWIAYRSNDALKIKTPDSLFQTTPVIKHINAFRNVESEAWVAVETFEEKSELWKLSSQGIFLERLSLPMKPRDLLPTQEGPRVFLIIGEDANSLNLYRLDVNQIKLIKPITSGVTGRYTKAMAHQGRVYVASFNELTGGLSLSSAPLENLEAWTTEVIEDPSTSPMYRGMDIALFPDKESVGLIYLDAWALKLRIAEKRKDKWFTEELPLSGALGFYSVVLGLTEETIEVAFHAFRSDHPDRRQTFEDLWIAEIRRRP